MSTTIEEKSSTAVTVVERAALALGASEHEKELIALSKKYADIVSIENKAGRDQVHSAAMELGNARIATKKNGEAAREDANAFRTAVIAEVNRRIAIVSAEEARLLALRDKWDAEREAEKIAKALAESQRITFIRQKIDAIRNTPQYLVGSPSVEIGAAAHVLSEKVISLDAFMEYTGEAQAERDNAVKQLRAMQEAMRQHEAEQQRLADERAELARKQAELVEQERLSASARAKQEAEDRFNREELERRDREEREAAEAELRKQQRLAEEAMRVQREAHEARMQAQQAELDAKQAVIDAAIAEQERVARVQQEAADAEIRRQQAEVRQREEAERERLDAEARRVQAEKDAEIARQLAEKLAADAEAERRERVQFETVGPEADEILSVLAEHYAVHKTVACNWLYRHAWAQMEVSA